MTVSRRVLLLCGPSGVGKGTIASLLLDEYPSRFGFSVSHTTRKLRDGEVDGVHYHSIPKQRMEREIEEGKFAEFARVHGNLYGTSFQALENVFDEGKVVLMDVDLVGVQSMKAVKHLESKCVGIVPPSFEELENRLRSRKTESDDQIRTRLERALLDIEFCKTNKAIDHLIVNSDSWKYGYPELKEYLQRVSFLP